LRDAVTRRGRDWQRFGISRPPPWVFTSKREPQIILKTDERKVILELGLEGKFAANQLAGTKTGFSSKETG